MDEIDTTPKPRRSRKAATAATKQPATKKAAANKTVAKAATKKAATKKAVTEKAATKKTVARKRTAKKASTKPQPPTTTITNAPTDTEETVETGVTVGDVLTELAAEHQTVPVSTELAEHLRTFLTGIITNPNNHQTQWSTLLGPVLTPAVAQTLLSLSPAGIDKRRRAGGLFAVQTETRRWLYPAAQFQITGRNKIEVNPRLPELLTTLNSPDPDAVARWLGTPNRNLNNRTPWQALADPTSSTELLGAAQTQAATWGGTP